MRMATKTKRTNILFDEGLWQRLARLARERESSVGELVRSAVHRTYFSDQEDRERKEALERILAIRPKPVKGKIDYEELINYGRER